MHTMNRPVASACPVAIGTHARQASSLRAHARGPNALKETCKVLHPFSSDNTAQRLPSRAARLACSAQAASTSQDNQVQCQEEVVGPTRLKLNITVPSGAVAQVYKQTLNEYRKGVSVAGFRKGKAPDSAVIGEVGGQERFNNTVMATILETTMKQAMQQYNARMIEGSDSIDQDGATLGKAFSPSTDFHFSVSFDVMPEVKWNRSYKDIAVAVESAGDDASDAAAVESKLEGLRKEGAKLRVVANRGMQVGDTVIMDIDIAQPESGESLIGGVRQGFQTDTATSDATFIPGVAAAMVGMAVGESRSATLTLPNSPDFHPANLRGKDATIQVTLKELFEYDLPEMDDAWAETQLPGCGGMAGLRQQMLEAQRKETDAKTTKAIEDALMEAVADAVDAPVPESLIMQLGQQEYQVKLQEAVAGGKLTMEVVQQLATEQLLMEFINKNRAELETTQRGLFGISEILKQEKLTATLAEIQAEFQAAVGGFEQFSQEYDKERLMEQVQQQIEGRKAMDWLLANAKVEVLPYQPK